MLSRYVCTLALLTFSATSFAESLDINLRDKSAQLQYQFSKGSDTLGKSDFHIGGLFTNDNNLLADFGILVKNEVGGNAPGVSLGVGIKGLTARVKPNNIWALSVGGQVRISPPADTRFGLVGEFYFSPNIVTFGDADRFYETGVRLEYAVTPRAVAYLGYRKIKFGLKSGIDATLDDGGHVGVRVMF